MQEQLSEDLNAPLVQDFSVIAPALPYYLPSMAVSVIAPCITLVSYICVAIPYGRVVVQGCTVNEPKDGNDS